MIERQLRPICFRRHYGGFRSGAAIPVIDLSESRVASGGRLSLTQ